jgi:hypothetical protein
MIRESDKRDEFIRRVWGEEVWGEGVWLGVEECGVKGVGCVGCVGCVGDGCGNKIMF